MRTVKAKPPIEKLPDFKKGDTLIMKGFTGIKLGRFAVEKVDAKHVTILTRKGDARIFDKKTGKQIKPNNPKFAMTIAEDDGTYINPLEKRRAAKLALEKKATKKPRAKKKVKGPDVVISVDPEDILPEAVEKVEAEPGEPVETPKKKRVRKAKVNKEIEIDLPDEVVPDTPPKKKRAKRTKKVVTESDEDYEEI